MSQEAKFYREADKSAQVASNGFLLQATEKRNGLSWGGILLIVEGLVFIALGIGYGERYAQDAAGLVNMGMYPAPVIDDEKYPKLEARSRTLEERRELQKREEAAVQSAKADARFSVWPLYLVGFNLLIVGFHLRKPVHS